MWIVFTWYQNRSLSSDLIPAPQKGFLAPNFRLQDINQVDHELTNYRGKIVIVNIWASWCKPCQYEMPALENIHNQYRDEIVLLAVNNLYQDSSTEVMAFVNANKLTFPILLDQTGEVSKQYQVQALPSTYFIDRSGKISEIIIGGPMSETLIKSILEKIEE